MNRELGACPFCSMPPDRLIAASGLAVGFRDSLSDQGGGTDLSLNQERNGSGMQKPPPIEEDCRHERMRTANLYRVKIQYSVIQQLTGLSGTAKILPDTA
jgi:hypothetical protein